MSRTKRFVPAFGVLTLLLISGSAAGWRSYAAQGQRKGPESGIVVGQGEPTVIANSVAGGPGFYAGSAFLFVPWRQDYQYAFGMGNGAELYNPGGGAAVYDAPVSLPQHATITRLVGYYYDASASSIEFDLMRTALAGADAAFLATVVSTGNSGYGVAQTTQVSQPVVELRSFSYLVQIALPPGSDTRVTGFRIDYEYSANLPVVQKDH